MSSNLFLVRKAEPHMQLLYCRRQPQPARLQALGDDLGRSARRFTRLGLTGTLLAGDGLTLEFMEGPVGALSAHWASLQQGSRAAAPMLIMKDVDATARLFAPRPLAVVLPATPLQMMALVSDVHWHAGHRAQWTMTTHQVAALVHQSASETEPRRRVGNE